VIKTKWFTSVNIFHEQGDRTFTTQKEISKDGNIKVPDFLIDSILVEFGGRIFQLSAFQLIRNLHPYLPTCFYIHMNLYKRVCDMLTIASPCEPLAAVNKKVRHFNIAIL
jgi:hypothetical protein